MKSIKCIFGYHNWIYGNDVQSHLPSRYCGQCRVYMTAVVNENWHEEGQPVLKWRWADDQDVDSCFVKGEIPWPEYFNAYTLMFRKNELLWLIEQNLHKKR